MTWGPCFMYYHCPQCGKKFKYDVSMIPDFGDDFGKCPDCKVDGKYEFDGARVPNDCEYPEIDE